MTPHLRGVTSHLRGVTSHLRGVNSHLRGVTPHLSVVFVHTVRLVQYTVHLHIVWVERLLFLGTAGWTGLFMKHPLYLGLLSQTQTTPTQTRQLSHNTRFASGQNAETQQVNGVLSTHLLEEESHLGLFGLEPLELLVDPLIPLQLLQGGPLTVEVRARRKSYAGQHPLLHLSRTGHITIHKHIDNRNEGD